ncbi:MAG TPA: HEAT repeat domain-containing protein, partial [Candidatus Hodarchaeales archaeon]|nr:HEAT repeat domain-containing protein [Candidatus Hodarchaeales archaeon]
NVRRAVMENVLVNAYQDENPDIRFGFAQVAQYFDQQTAPQLLQLVNDRDESISEVALDSLGRISQRNGVEGAIVAAVAKKLDSKNPNTRLAVVKALQGMGNEAIPSLIQALGDGDPAVQNTASEAIDSIGEAGLPALVETLGSRDPRTRDLAAKLIGNHSERAWEPIIERLSITDSEFRSAASETMKFLGDGFAERLLTTVQTTMDEEAHYTAILGFGKLKYKPALTFISTIVGTGNKKLAEAVRSAYQQEYKELLTGQLLRDLERSSGVIERNIVEFFQKADSRWVVVPMILALKNTRKEVTLVDLLKKMGEKSVSEAVVRLLEEKDLQSAKEVVKILRGNKELVKLAEKVSFNVPQ